MDEQQHLENKIQEELFRLKLYRNMSEIQEYQKSTIINKPITTQVEYYSPDDIKQILDRTAKFTKNNLSWYFFYSFDIIVYNKNVQKLIGILINVFHC